MLIVSNMYIKYNAAINQTTGKALVTDTKVLKPQREQ